MMPGLYGQVTEYVLRQCEKNSSVWTESSGTPGIEQNVLSANLVEKSTCQGRNDC